jgi:hypothetical protein
VSPERERLQELHLALEGALEQLTRAHANAAAAPLAPELATVERLLGELALLRNAVRERLMRVLAKPTMTILK